MTFKHQALALLLVLSCARLGATEFVVIVHPSAQAMTKEKAADIFLGKEPTLTPVDYVDTVPIRAEFYKKLAARDLAQIKTVWIRLVFTGKGIAPKEYPDAAAVKRAVAADPKVVGYIEKSALDGTVKAALLLE